MFVSPVLICADIFSLSKQTHPNRHHQAGRLLLEVQSGHQQAMSQNRTGRQRGE